MPLFRQRCRETAREHERITDYRRSNDGPADARFLELTVRQRCVRRLSVRSDPWWAGRQHYSCSDDYHLGRCAGRRRTFADGTGGPVEAV